jgi:hypothetical protein
MRPQCREPNLLGGGLPIRRTLAPRDEPQTKPPAVVLHEWICTPVA